MKYVVVTGASSGIGRACARKLIERGFHVFGSVRNERDGESLRDALGEGFSALLFDVTDDTMVRAAAGSVEARIGSKGLAGLVNNAGIVVDGPLAHLPIDRLRAQFEVNLFGTMSVTQAFLPLLGAKRGASASPGRIVNISSVSGRVAFPFMGAYAASKHALEGLSDAFRRELLPYGIDVILIEPAAIRTAIDMKTDRISPYADTEYGPSHQRALDGVHEMMQSARPPEAVAETVHTALTCPKPKTRYVLAGRTLRWLIMSRVMPDRWVDSKLTGELRRLWRG